MKKVFYIVSFIFIMILVGCGMYQNQIEKESTISTQAIQKLFYNAQEDRINELAESMEQYIGCFECGELVRPMAIGQDSTRNQLGIDLTDTFIEICSDFSVQINNQKYEIENIAAGDVAWYLDAFRIAPNFMEGQIIEVFYKNGSDRFSICFAENGIYPLSYAYGFYDVKNLKKNEKMSERNISQDIRKAYQQQYGTVEEQIALICGVWNGKKILTEGIHRKLVGEYEFEIRVDKNSGYIVLLNEDPIEFQVENVECCGEFSEGEFLRANGVFEEDVQYMSTRRESFAIALKEEKEQVIILLPQYDFLGENGGTMDIYYKGDVYFFTNDNESVVKK